VIAHILNLRMASRQVKAMGLNALDRIGYRTRCKSRRPGRVVNPQSDVLP